jgi:DNA-binding XRE family transcriptional regulator
MASAPNVLRCDPETFVGVRSLFGRPSSRSYRIAVAQTIRDVKARHKLSNERLAELIGCSEQTVANAENECGDMQAVTLLSLGYAFGEEAIAPVRALYLCAPAEELTELEQCRRALRELTALEKRLSA